MKKNQRWAVLIYTIFLVVLSVFMAAVILNVAVNLSNEYDVHIIELGISGIIESKGDASIKYSKETNSWGSGFIDNIECPQDISFTESSVLTSGVDTQYVFSGSIAWCQWVYNSNPFYVLFNSGYTDTSVIQHKGIQIPFSNTTRTWTLLTSPNIFVDGTITFPLWPDGIDDNFDSDNFSISSTGTTYYPQGYIDDDADIRLKQYGYIVENSWLYNVFWSNKKVFDYIDDNPLNYDTVYKRIGSTSTGFLYIDINAWFKPVLYVIDKWKYQVFKEIEIISRTIGPNLPASIGYIQNDLTIGSSTGSAYRFDFTQYDYALFLENTSSWALIYQIRWYDALSGSGLYINPLNDSGTSVLSYLWSHILVNDEGKLIGDMFEVLSIK